MQKGKVVPTNVCKKAIRAYERGKSSAAVVAARYGMSEITFWRILRRKRSTGQYQPAPHIRRGAALCLDENEHARLKALALNHPMLSHKDLLAALQEELGKPITKWQLLGALRRLGLIKKRSSKSVLPRPKTSYQSSVLEAENKKIYNISNETRKIRDNKRYASDTTDEEWKIIEEIFKMKIGRPPTKNRRDIVDAIFYISRSGCQWRMLPKDFPDYRTVYSCFSRWNKRGIWKILNDMLRKKHRKEIGKEEQPSAGSVDSQSAKTTEKGGPKALMVTKKSREENVISL